MKIESGNFKVKKIKHPYPIWIIDNFFDKNVLQNIKKEWPEINSKLWHRGHEYINHKKNILEQGMLAISKIEHMGDFTSRVIKYIHSDDFTQRISDITNEKNLVTDTTMRWSGLRTMLPNSFQAIHSDARRAPINGLRKELTCLVYLSENYDKDKHSGQFEVWSDDMAECIHKINPLYNRLVIFLNSDTSYHGVPSVNFERRAMLWSILKDGESTNRSKALFVSRPNDSSEISKLGLERAYIKDKK